MRDHHFRLSRLRAALFGFLLCQYVLLAQTPARLTLSVDGTTEQFKEPAVPSDHFELVTGDAQAIEDASQRADVVNLVTEARRHSNVRAQPYSMKTSFTASGNGSSDGTWELQDISPGKNTYRWTAEGPGFSAINLYVNGVLYSNRELGSLPIRLAQARAAMFFTEHSLGPRAFIRKAAGNLDGVDLTCVLVSHNMDAKTVSGGRSWDEAETCIDPNSSTVIAYSPIPGLYIHYDYSNGIRFHEALVPGKFTIMQGNQPIIQAQTVSVTDPSGDPALFQPAGLSAMGKGPAISSPWHYHADAPAPSGVSVDQPQMVVVHAMQSPKGRLSDIEVISSSNNSLNNSARHYASKWKSGPMGAVVAPGATPQSHEVFLTLRYVPPQQNKSGSGSNQ